MKSLLQWLKYHYYKNALARSERDLEMLEKMFTARKNQILNQQDNLVCKLWAAHSHRKLGQSPTRITATSAAPCGNPSSAPKQSAAISRPSAHAKSASSY